MVMTFKINFLFTCQLRGSFMHGMIAVLSYKWHWFPRKKNQSHMLYQWGGKSHFSLSHLQFLWFSSKTLCKIISLTMHHLCNLSSHRLSSATRLSWAKLKSRAQESWMEGKWWKSRLRNHFQEIKYRVKITALNCQFN